MVFEKLYLIFFIVYFAAVTGEAWYSYKKNLDLYEKRDTVVNLTLGILVSLSRIFLDAFRVQFWYFVSAYSWFEFGSFWYIWLLLFLGNEFVYYWFHRWCHNNRFLWAIHVNHHSSERLNLSTASRLPILVIFVQTVFWAPLALLGFDPMMIFIVFQLSLIFVAYQHSRVLGKFGWAEYLFNSPTHHSLHHASNPEYINKNFGLVLIIFDRLFGTFVTPKDGVKIEFGIKNNIRSNNLLIVIFHEWISIFKDYRNKWFRGEKFTN